MSDAARIWVNVDCGCGEVTGYFKCFRIPPLFVYNL